MHRIALARIPLTLNVSPHFRTQIGFNAGHSAVTMLFHSHNKLVSFDTEDLPWSAGSLAFVQRMYPGRVERVKGNSIETVPAFAKSDPRKFDLFAVDGMHSGEFPYKARARCHTVTRLIVNAGVRPGRVSQLKQREL